MSPKRQISLFALLLFLTLTVLGLQNDRVGFQSGHHGWVTSQHLAIIQRSSPANLGVGYVGEILQTDGSLQYFYFNRAPFVFEALAHLALRPFETDLAAYVSAAHQLFNLVYVMTLVVAFFLARLWLKSDSKAIFATLMLGSGYYFLEYKDLVEQNRLGALAALLAIYAVADFERHQNVKRLLGLASWSLHKEDSGGMGKCSSRRLSFEQFRGSNTRRCKCVKYCEASSPTSPAAISRGG